MSCFKSITKICEIKEYLENPSDTLVIFDVDYVLTHPNESAYQFPNFSKNIEFIRELFLQLTPLERDVFANLMVFDLMGSSLVESDSPLFIKEIQDSGYKAFALTAILTSDLDGFSPKKSRIQKLKELKINFSDALPCAEEIVFNSLIPNRNTYPTFSNGILFSNGENQANQKGATLKAFLNMADLKPKKILVIDDRKPNLEAIAKEFEEENISIVGFHYKGSLVYPSKSIKRDLFEKKWNTLFIKAKELAASENQFSAQNE